MFDNTSLVTLYAVTPCHAGSGSSVGVVDLPIQRERHTNYPIIQASGVKGAFKANFKKHKTKEKFFNYVWNFGSVRKNSGKSITL